MYQIPRRYRTLIINRVNYELHEADVFEYDLPSLLNGNEKEIMKNN